VKVVRYDIDSKEWARILLLRPIPRNDDIWGDLAPLRDTPWGDVIYEITGEALSHALHGHVMPLMRQLGVPPSVLAKRIPPGYRRCDLHKNCILAQPVCEPGPELPACYVPPGVPIEARQAVSVVALAWKEGRHVVVIEGPEFSL
jgi:hypothetical protein